MSEAAAKSSSKTATRRPSAPGGRKPACSSDETSPRYLGHVSASQMERAASKDPDTVVPGIDPNDPTYVPTDCWTTLGGLARDTSRVRLGALVGAATFRQPGLLALRARGFKSTGDFWWENSSRRIVVPVPPTMSSRTAATGR